MTIYSPRLRPKPRAFYFANQSVSFLDEASRGGAERTGMEVTALYDWGSVLRAAHDIVRAVEMLSPTRDMVAYKDDVLRALDKTKDPYKEKTK